MNQVLNFAVVTMCVVVMASSRFDTSVVNMTEGSSLFMCYCCNGTGFVNDKTCRKCNVTGTYSHTPRFE